MELRRIPLTTGHREHRSSRPPAFTTTQICVQEHHSSSEYSNQCIETGARIIRTWDGPVLTKARNHFLCLQSCSIDPGQRIVREENLQTRNGDEIVVAVELFDLVVYCSLAATGYPLGTGERSDHGAERKAQEVSANNSVVGLVPRICLVFSREGIARGKVDREDPV